MGRCWDSAGGLIGSDCKIESHSFVCDGVADRGQNRHGERASSSTTRTFAGRPPASSSSRRSPPCRGSRLPRGCSHGFAGLRVRLRASVWALTRRLVAEGRDRVQSDGAPLASRCGVMAPGLPNLLIIGAAKCGTTSLHYYLDQHPDVFMARPDDSPGGQKEMRYFWRDDWRELLEWYEQHFDSSAAVRGEATPSYAHYPYFRDVPRRIHSLIPQTKLIYLLRDPIDRIVAHWAQTQEDGDRTPLEEALADFDRPDHPIVCASKYATQCEHYLAYFAPSQLLVLDMHDLQGDRLAQVCETFRFLGVDDKFRSPAFVRELNTRRDKRALTPFGSGLWDHALEPVGRRLPRGLRRRAAQPIRRMLSRNVNTPPLAKMKHPSCETCSGRRLIDCVNSRARTSPRGP